MPTERVLVVDDDPAILNLCHQILEADGYVLAEAKRGEEALSRLERESFELLLTDIRLPGTNGLVLAQKLRERQLELPIITMTGYSNMEMAIQALSLGVDEFIVKPFTPDTLRIHVSRALEKSRLRRENLRLRTLLPLLETAQGLAGARSREQVAELLVAGVVKHLGLDELAFLAVVSEGNAVRIMAAQGALFAPLYNQVFGFDPSGWTDIFRARSVRVWSETERKPLPLDPLQARRLVAVPVGVQEQLHGLLMAAPDRALPASDIEAIQVISSQAAAAFENVKLVAEISRAYRNAVELERLKSDFINIAGHEIRTPLAVVMGYAALLRERVGGELREYADELIGQATRLQRIADNMLNLKYLEDGHVELNLEQCAVDQVVRQVVNAYQGIAQEREQSFQVQVAEQAGSIHADRAMLDLMLGSLVSNAIKFSPRRATIYVRAEGDLDQVTFVVQDQGSGLAPEEVAHVFDAFYQTESSLTRRTGGLGIGLTLARAMVQAHQGKIWVESKPQSGSSFFISLPRQRLAPN